MSDVSNGYMDASLDWVPGMKDIKLRDFPSFIRTTDIDDVMLNFLIHETDRLPKASALIINTFDNLEKDSLEALSTIQPRAFAIGPLSLMLNQITDKRLESMRSNLWKEEDGCIEWLNTKEPNSVVYVNFGSITVMTAHQLIEFAWGLANSNKHFLWIIRPDIVVGESAMLPPEFVTVTQERGMLAGWCPQEEVLKHPAIAGFFTHSGWNSTIESICGGVPVICWPFFAEQQTNCRYSCVEWEMGMEIDNNVKREEVKGLVIELMETDKGREMKKKATAWKKEAEEATWAGGKSRINFDKLVNEILLPK